MRRVFTVWCSFTLALGSLLCLENASLHAQMQTVSGLNGLGGSTYVSLVSLDRDRDGYGPGPTAIIATTTSSGATTAGVNVITPSSMTGTVSASTTNGSNQLCNIPDSRPLQVNETVAGTGIPSGMAGDLVGKRRNSDGRKH
jgi:hypothetical protein